MLCLVLLLLIPLAIHILFFMINAEEYYKNLPQDTEYLDFNELARMGDELDYVNRPSKEPTDYFYFPQPQKKGND